MKRKPIKVTGKFATPYDVGKALGMPRSRVDRIVARVKKLLKGTNQ